MKEIHKTLLFTLFFVVLCVGCMIGIWLMVNQSASRPTETITSIIIEKHREFWLIPIPHTDFYFIMENGDHVDVTRDVFFSFEIGNQYSYIRYS